MYKRSSIRLAAVAALVAAGWIQLAGGSVPADSAAALQRAADAWDKGDYVAALTAYQDLLAGADANAALEPIALQTGELIKPEIQHGVDFTCRLH